MIDIHAGARHGVLGQRLEEIAARSLDARPAFSTIADEIMIAERRLFDTGRGWPADKPSTLKRKAARQQDLRTLHATGKGAAALTRRGAPGQKLVISRKELRFGIVGGRSPVFYMRFQKARGRDPLVSRDVIRRLAKPVLAEFVVHGR